MWHSPPEFDALYESVFNKWTDEAMTGLLPAERDFVIANVCVNQSMNTGLMGYYESSYGRHANEAVAVFQRIGALNAAAVLSRSHALMGPRGPSDDLAERGDQLDALTDAALEEMVECSDELNALEGEVRSAAMRWVVNAGNS